MNWYYDNVFLGNREDEAEREERTFIELEERVIEVLNHAGFSTIADCLMGSDGWNNAINALMKELRDEC